MPLAQHPRGKRSLDRRARARRRAQELVGTRVSVNAQQAMALARHRSGLTQVHYTKFAKVVMTAPDASRPQQAKKAMCAGTPTYMS